MLYLIFTIFSIMAIMQISSVTCNAIFKKHPKFVFNDKINIRVIRYDDTAISVLKD